MRSWALALVLVAALVPGCSLPLRPPDPPLYYEDVLGADPYTKLVVQIDHAPGRAPSEVAKTHLLMTLKNVTSKTEITLDVRQSLDDDERAWTADDLIALERETRRTRHEAPVALMHVLYPAGTYASANAAGVTISGPVLGPVVVFLDVIRELTVGTPLGPLPLENPEAASRILERSTLLHEAGHAMGLVDNGLPMVSPHEDPDNQGHSRNPASVMSWKVDSENGLRELLLDDDSVPDRFDADDLADLRSAGGR